MTSKRERLRRRRKNERMSDSAWKALEDGNPSLARRLIERALKTGFINARLWLDQASILRRCEEPLEAERSLRRALELQPSFREAQVQLAELLEQQGAQSEAQELRALLDSPPASDGAARVLPRIEPRCTQSVDWERVERDLGANGAATVAGSWSVQDLLALESALRLGDRVDLSDAIDASVIARQVLSPAPAPLIRCVAEWFQGLEPIAARWNRSIGRGAVFHEIGQMLERIAADDRTTAGLIDFASGDLAARCLELETQDWFDASAFFGDGGDFPFHVLLALGIKSSGESRSNGGQVEQGPALEITLVDLARRRSRQRRHELKLFAGDAAVVCPIERLVDIAGVKAIQPRSTFLRAGPAGARFLTYHPRSTPMPITGS